MLETVQFKINLTMNSLCDFTKNASNSEDTQIKLLAVPKKNGNKLDVVKMIKNRYTFATKNMFATSNRQTRYKTQQKKSKQINI